MEGDVRGGSDGTRGLHGTSCLARGGRAGGVRSQAAAASRALTCGEGIGLGVGPAVPLGARGGVRKGMARGSEEGAALERADDTVLTNIASGGAPRRLGSPRTRHHVGMASKRMMKPETNARVPT